MNEEEDTEQDDMYRISKGMRAQATRMRTVEC